MNSDAFAIKEVITNRIKIVLINARKAKSPSMVSV